MVISSSAYTLLGIAITAITPIIVLLIKLREERIKNSSLKQEALNLEEKRHILESQVKDLSHTLVTSLDCLRDVDHSIGNLFTGTNADRFLLFSANNGKHRLRYVNCVSEKHKEENGNAVYLMSLGATVKYRGIEIDDQYHDMLTMAEKKGYVNIKTKYLPNCNIKKFYIEEGVTEGFIFFVSRIKLDQDNDKIIFFSLATHKKDGFTDESRGYILDRLGHCSTILNNTLNEYNKIR
jgi:hypothetical protein